MHYTRILIVEVRLGKVLTYDEDIAKHEHWPILSFSFSHLKHIRKLIFIIYFRSSDILKVSLAKIKEHRNIF